MLVTYNITLSLITKTNQGPRCFHSFNQSIGFQVPNRSKVQVVSHLTAKLSKCFRVKQGAIINFLRLWDSEATNDILLVELLDCL